MSAHDDYLDPDKHLWPVELPDWWDDMETNCREILKDFGAQHWGEVYRQLYKYTPCGPTLGVLCSGQDAPAYNGELTKFLADSPVVEILVSSIVEGSDAETGIERVDMKQPGALARLHSAVSLINAQADALWREANMHVHASRRKKRTGRK